MEFLVFRLKKRSWKSEPLRKLPLIPKLKKKDMGGLGLFHTFLAWLKIASNVEIWNPKKKNILLLKYFVVIFIDFA